MFYRVVGHQMDENGVPRRICSAAAKRYARPPPPVPILPNESIPPRIPPRDPLDRDTAHHHHAQIHVSSRPPPPPIPRSPRPPAPEPVVHTTTVVHTTQPQSAPFREVINLEHVRQGPRPLNDYIDHPVKSTSSTTTSSDSNSRTQSVPIFTQPKKDPKDPNLTVDEDLHQDSIICSKCGKCKCKDCTQPRDCCRTRWICNNSVECSPDKVVEYCSCLCCVQCIFYHCCDQRQSDDELSATDDPCACCERPNCCRRWTCMGVMSLCLPCLCCYWPLSCALSLCKGCYTRCSRRGCHCRRDKPANMKRLLIDSESSSA